MSGHPKFFPPAPGINAPKAAEWIDINALDRIDPVHFFSRTKRQDDAYDYDKFSQENGDGRTY